MVLTTQVHKADFHKMISLYKFCKKIALILDSRMTCLCMICEYNGFYVKFNDFSKITDYEISSVFDLKTSPYLVYLY